MKKYFSLIRCIVFTILLVFASLFISHTTDGLKSDPLIEKYNFTYIPFVLIYIVLLLTSIVYSLITNFKIKSLFWSFIVLILSIILYAIGNINMNYTMPYSFKYLFIIINVDYFIYTFVIIVKYLINKDKDFLKAN